MSSVAQPLQFNEQYYTNLVISQYRDSTNFNLWLSANLQLFQDATICLNSFNAAFDLSQAFGVQLDVLGLIIGVNRTVNFQPSNSVSPVLDDTTYRLVLQAGVFKNHWNGLTSSLHTIWNVLFPGGTLVITDAQNMTCTLLVSGAFSSIIQDLITNGYMLPRPQGVLFTYEFAVLPILGFDQQTEYISGWATSGAQYGYVNVSGTAVTRVAATTTGTALIDSTQLTVASAANITIGQGVSGTGIAAGTSVVNIIGDVITLSLQTTAPLSSTSVSFIYPGSPFVSGNAGATIVIGDLAYVIATYSDANDVVLTTSAGTQTNVMYSISTGGGHFAS